ncbi:MAG: hypothetical protein FWE34_05090 [Defluviitaleaceae bacterium]|nr:hypothetical protein [Defluviitaleaceae bacterium]
MKKRLLSMLLAMIMVFTFATTVYADPWEIWPWPRIPRTVAPCPDMEE